MKGGFLMLKVLIADDEMIERKYLTALFGKYPHLFTIAGEARNGKEVLRLAEQLRPDVIIMDINMPFCDGLTCANEIRQRHPDTIILLNTAYAEFEFARRAVEYQLDAYLLKPAKEEVILQAIESCLRKKRRSSGAPSAYAEALVKRSGSAADAVALVCDYIDANPQLSLTLEELARIAHFSPSYLSRIFREQKGVTISAYITQKRLENAKYLLIHSKMDVRTVAAHCGFQTVSHFNRVFKQEASLSPLEFRRKFSVQEAEDEEF